MKKIIYSIIIVSLLLTMNLNYTFAADDNDFHEIQPRSVIGQPVWEFNNGEYDDIVMWVNDIGMVPTRLRMEYSFWVNYTPKELPNGSLKITTNEQIYTKTFYYYLNFPASYSFNFLSSIAEKNGGNLEVFYENDYNDNPSLDFIWDPSTEFYKAACKDSVLMDYPDRFNAGFMWISGECLPSVVNLSTDIGF